MVKFAPNNCVTAIAKLKLYNGPIPEVVVPISHLDTKYANIDSPFNSVVFLLKQKITKVQVSLWLSLG